VGQEKSKPLARLIPAMALKVNFPQEPPGPFRPEIITSAEDLAKSPVVMGAAAHLTKQVDFSTEKLAVFAWEGRPKEVVGPTATKIEDKKRTVVFTFTPAGATKGSREYIVLYAVPRDAEVQVVRNPKVPK
jgi:hypothetical protein